MVKLRKTNPGNAARRVFRQASTTRSQFPDATLEQKIRVHKLIIKRVCPVLGNCWKLSGFNCKSLQTAVQGLKAVGTSTVHYEGLNRSTAAVNSAQPQTHAEAASSASALTGDGGPTDNTLVTLHCECALCQFSSVEHDTGVMLLEDMYTGRLRWPHGEVPD